MCNTGSGTCSFYSAWGVGGSVLLAPLVTCEFFYFSSKNVECWYASSCLVCYFVLPVFPTLGFVTIVLDLGSIMFACLLLHFHRWMADWIPAHASQYIESIKSCSLGIQTTGLFFSLPLAFLLYATFLFAFKWAYFLFSWIMLCKLCQSSQWLRTNRRSLYLYDMYLFSQRGTWTI